MKRTKNDTKEEEKADTLKPALEFFRFFFFFKPAAILGVAGALCSRVVLLTHHRVMCRPFATENRILRMRINVTYAFCGGRILSFVATFAFKSL